MATNDLADDILTALAERTYRVGELAERTGRSRDAVGRALRALRARGVAAVVAHGRSGNLWGLPRP